ncbi:MAG: hypothetical protein N3A66_04385, partial [Planctomycetota bacterium]|nr:hypothetical protein [Planctomycetota bacterium]
MLLARLVVLLFYLAAVLPSMMLAADEKKPDIVAQELSATERAFARELLDLAEFAASKKLYSDAMVFVQRLLRSQPENEKAKALQEKLRGRIEKREASASKKKSAKDADVWPEKELAELAERRAKAFSRLAAQYLRLADAYGRTGDEARRNEALLAGQAIDADDRAIRLALGYCDDKQLGWITKEMASHIKKGEWLLSGAWKPWPQVQEERTAAVKER